METCRCPSCLAYWRSLGLCPWCYERHPDEEVCKSVENKPEPADSGDKEK